jgi:hypothetical protein
MATEAPAVFNVHVKAFLDGIWGGLRDPRLHIREASVNALGVRGGGGAWEWAGGGDGGRGEEEGRGWVEKRRLVCQCIIGF